MNILITANMGPGTLQAKVEPLSRCKQIQKIYFARKNTFETINKTEYLILPKLCKYSIFNLLFTPFYLIYYIFYYKIDLIISYHMIPHAFFAYFAHLITRKPFIVCQTGLYVQKYAEKNKIFSKIIMHILSKALFVNVPGKQSKNFWKNLGLNNHKINILHSTINTEYFIPQSKDYKYDFIFTGRLHPIKNIDKILLAFSKVKNKLKNQKMAIVGSGIMLEKLQKTAIKLNISENVDFLGFHKDIKLFLDKSKFFIMASKSEALPCALMEAMSNGNVPISTNVGNIKDIVQNEVSGFLINSNEEIDQIMLKALSITDDTYRDMSARARQIIIDNYSYNIATNKWSKIIKIVNE